MADTRFIRTVEFGGYDRNDVIKRFEFLNTQLFDLKNELRETKMLIEEYKKGSSEEKAHEAVLTQEKVKLTSLQVQNETASTKLKAAEEDKAKLAEELTALKATHADTLKELEDIKADPIIKTRNNKLEAYQDKLASLQFLDPAAGSGNFLTDTRGKGGVVFHRRGAVCLETQLWPDAMNHWGFPSPILHKGEKLTSTTVYSFTVE